MAIGLVNFVEDFGCYQVRNGLATSTARLWSITPLLCVVLCRELVIYYSSKQRCQNNYLFLSDLITERLPTCANSS